MCGLLIFIVVKKIDDIKEVHIQGSGIAFRGHHDRTRLSAEQQRERSQQVQDQLAREVRDAPAAPAAPASVDLSGTWTTDDGATQWTIALEQGVFVFREQTAAYPGVITATGYGEFDGRTWSLQCQTIFGTGGTTTLELSSENVLAGEAVINGERFALTLQR